MFWQHKEADAAKACEDAQNNNKEAMMTVPVMMRPDELNVLRVEPEKTVAAILKDLKLNQNYGLVLVHHDASKQVVGREILNGSDSLGQHRERLSLEVESPEEASLWLVDLSMEVTVFFNAYFRMAMGTPEHLLRVYLQPGQTVGEFETVVKTLLRLPEAKRGCCGLYGFANNELVKLDAGLLMSELRERDNQASPSYFQFQWHPEAENQAHLGVIRASNLFMRAARGLRRTKKAYFSLQGTSLFYRPAQKDHGWVKEIQRVDQCKIVYRGGNRKQTEFRFDIIPPPGAGPVRIFTSPLKRRVIRWVRELRRCHPSLQISDPISMTDVIKIPNARIAAGSSLVRQRNAAIRDLEFYDRRAIELAEGHLQAVELAGGLLLHNGLDSEAMHETGRAWVESMRLLILHVSRMQPTATASDNVALIHRMLKKLRDWVAHFEEDWEAVRRRRSSPEASGLQELIEDAGFLVNCYRMYQVKKDQGDADEYLQDEAQMQVLEEMLGALQDSLACSIFEARPVRSYRVRAARKDEMPPTPKPEPERLRRGSSANASTLNLLLQGEEEAGPSATVLDEQILATGRIERAGFTNPKRNREPVAVMAEIFPAVPPAHRHRPIPAGNDEYYEEDEELLATASRKTPTNRLAWFKEKLVGFFHRPDFRAAKQPEDGLGDDDDISFTISLENGDRIEDQRWPDAGRVFKACAGGASAKISSAEASPKDNNKESRKKSRSKASGSEIGEMAHLENIWGVPETSEPIKTTIVAPSRARSITSETTLDAGAAPKKPKKATRSNSQAALQQRQSDPESAADSPTTYGRRMTMPAAPERTDPEEEAELLRLMKDPGVLAKLRAIREGKSPSQEATPAIEPNVARRPSWGGRARRERAL